VSNEAPRVPPPEGSPAGGGLAEGARAIHALLAAVAALAFVGLFAWEWYRGEALQNPVPAMLIVLTLALGAELARRIALRLERVRGTGAVSALLRVANTSEKKEEQDGMDESPGRRRSRLILYVMSLQIALTGAAGIAVLAVLIQFAGPRTEVGFDAWPGVASIILLEGMYIAWLAEGQAAADELILVARRWVRSGELGSPSPVLVSKHPSPEELFAARARFLRDVLARYGVDLNAVVEGVHAPNVPKVKQADC
jgi:hypothetical protein